MKRKEVCDRPTPDDMKSRIRVEEGPIMIVVSRHEAMSICKGVWIKTSQLKHSRHALYYRDWDLCIPNRGGSRGGGPRGPDGRLMHDSFCSIFLTFFSRIPPRVPC